MILFRPRHCVGRTRPSRPRRVGGLRPPSLDRRGPAPATDWRQAKKYQMRAELSAGLSIQGGAYAPPTQQGEIAFRTSVRLLFKSLNTLYIDPV